MTIATVSRLVCLLIGHPAFVRIPYGRTEIFWSGLRCTRCRQWVSA